MKKLISMFLASLLLVGCASTPKPEPTPTAEVAKNLTIVDEITKNAEYTYIPFGVLEKNEDNQPTRYSNDYLKIYYDFEDELDTTDYLDARTKADVFYEFFVLDERTKFSNFNYNDFNSLGVKGVFDLYHLVPYCYSSNSSGCIGKGTYFGSNPGYEGMGNCLLDIIISRGIGTDDVHYVTVSYGDPYSFYNKEKLSDEEIVNYVSSMNLYFVDTRDENVIKSETRTFIDRGEEWKYVVYKSGENSSLGNNITFYKEKDGIFSMVVITGDGVDEHILKKIFENYKEININI